MNPRHGCISPYMEGCMAKYNRFVKSRLTIALCVLCLRVPMDKTYNRFERIQKLSYEIYEKRMRNGKDGTPNGDWKKAEQTPHFRTFYARENREGL